MEKLDALQVVCPPENLDHLKNGTLVLKTPDHYCRARPRQIDRRKRSELLDQIVPSTQQGLQIAPNLFLAAKGLDESASVAKRHTYYDGALRVGQKQYQSSNNTYIISFGLLARVRMF
jgi:hypothetical protein